MIRDELHQAKSDVSIALEIWKELMEDTEFAYVKGSAIKPWESDIDYVPLISDVDIHFKPNKKFEESLNLKFAIDLVSNYDIIFKRENPDYLHIPRIQLMNINSLKENVAYIPPSKRQISPLLGVPILDQPPKSHIIRKIDLKNVEELEALMKELPMSVIDRRSDMELWHLLRRLNWRVSPTPVRVLTQVLDENPMEIWFWNRTKIVKELKSAKIFTIAEGYKRYYELGWDLFNSDLKSKEIYFEMIITAYNIFKDTLKYINVLQSQDLGI